MISKEQTIRVSKFLSLVLRHQPEAISLRLDEGGWADVSELLSKLAHHGFKINVEDLQQVVITNNKNRFAFNEDGTRIRASQGHSIEVNLGYAEAVPPAVLYHGTAEKNREAILQKGLLKQGRQHVHLSTDKETAMAVGRRHGKPVVMQVSAGDMHKDGYHFYFSANGVWLTDEVPAMYLQKESN